MNDTNTQTQQAIHNCVDVSELQHTDNVQQEMKNVEKINGKLNKEVEKLKAGDVQCR